MALNSFIFFLLGLIFLLIVFSLVTPSRSKQYRRMLTDMYVVGKIKKFANKEDVDIKVELSEFAKFTKNKKIDFEALDDSIERELQESLASNKEDTSLKVNPLE